jgi:hypothetical protein
VVRTPDAVQQIIRIAVQQIIKSQVVLEFFDTKKFTELPVQLAKSLVTTMQLAKSLVTTNAATTRPVQAIKSQHCSLI